MKKLFHFNNIALSFIIFVFVVSYVWQFIIYKTGGIDSKLFPVLMLFPGLVAVEYRIYHKEGFRNVGWGLRRWWYIFAAVIIPVLIIVIVVVLIRVLNLESFSEKRLSFNDSGVFSWAFSWAGYISAPVVFGFPQ